MGKSAVDIVNYFLADSGLSLEGTSLKNCLDFAEIILKMEDDVKHAQPSVSNCLAYAENKVDKERRISHGTFYNDVNLNAMLNWYVSGKKEGKSVADNPRVVKKLEETIRKQKKQIEGLIVSQQSFDSISADYHRAQMNALRNRILFRRAMAVLKSLGKDSEIDLNVSPSELGIPFVNTETGEILEPDSVGIIDVQDVVKADD